MTASIVNFLDNEGQPLIKGKSVAVPECLAVQAVFTDGLQELPVGGTAREHLAIFSSNKLATVTALQVSVRNRFEH